MSAWGSSVATGTATPTATRIGRRRELQESGDKAEQQLFWARLKRI